MFNGLKGLDVAAFVPLVMRGMRATEPEKLADEIAAQLRDYLQEPADLARVAHVAGLVSFKLSQPVKGD